MHSAHQFSNIIGNSAPMRQVFELIETIAGTGSTVLITGESGTGKELVARAIHVRSPRSERPFVAVNCGALTETLLDSELFGHMRGAFTGADGNKKGLIEVADKGTIFLDEIGEMSPMLQVKLLRVLQERKFRRVGGTEEVDADIRIIAATNRDLAKMVAEGQFREDLFYRINVIPVRLPPLRERLDDVPMLAEHFVGKFAAQMSKPITGISGAAMVQLSAHSWPGNVRELENAMERAVALERTPADPAREPARDGARHSPGRHVPVDRGLHRRRRRRRRWRGRCSTGVRSRAARPAPRARIHRRSAAPVGRREGEGRRTARHDLPLVPLLHEEVQPQVNEPRQGQGLAISRALADFWQSQLTTPVTPPKKCQVSHQQAFS